MLKVGSSSLAPEAGGLRSDAVAAVADQVEALWRKGHPTVLVSSGAVAAGLPALGLGARPRDLPELQVAAAVGQGRLMQEYAAAFQSLDRVVGQVLLTRDILADRSQYLHARDALERMLALGVVPIVNENDTVVVDELKLGDNDTLAAIVTHLVSADMLVILTDTAGLYAADPRTKEDAELLKAVRDTDEILDTIQKTSGVGRLGSGGVATKVSAARMAAWSGVPTVVADSAESSAALRAVAGEEIGTFVEPRDSRLTARKLWIAFGLPSEGSLRIDDGAVSAVVETGKSLLSAGVVDIEGDFSAGAAVEVIDNDSTLIAKGMVRIAADELREGRGQHTSVVGGPAIRRDDLVVLRT